MPVQLWVPRCHSSLSWQQRLQWQERALPWLPSAWRLDLCPFTFSLNIGSSFSFSLDTRVSSTSKEVVKKKLSPSAMRSNVRRKEDFLKRKSEGSKKSDNNLEVEPSSQVVIFQCDQCDQSFKTNGLKIHVWKTHKDIITQLDGQTDDIAASLEVKTCVTKQSDAIKSETQTNSAYRKGLISKWEDFEYTTREKLDLVKHAENIHHQCAECGLDLPSKSSL